MSVITQQVENLIKSGLAAKVFSTGSKGFFVQGKVEDGLDRYQAMAQAVLIGSKNNPKVKVRVSAAEMADAMTAMVGRSFPAKTFSTGRTGYRTQGKTEAGGQMFQVSAQAVKLR
jgi:hypothetical protein